MEGLYLALSALGCLVIFRHYQGRPQLEQDQLVCLAFSLVCWLLSVLLGSWDEQPSTLGLLFANLVHYVAMPFSAIALAVLVLAWPLSRPHWGKLLLGAMAGFELGRRLDWGYAYRELLWSLAALCLLWASVQLWRRRQAVAAASYAGAALSLVLSLPVRQWWPHLGNPDYWLAAYLLLLSLSLLLLSKRATH